MARLTSLAVSLLLSLGRFFTYRSRPRAKSCPYRAPSHFGLSPEVLAHNVLSDNSQGEFPRAV